MLPLVRPPRRGATAAAILLDGLLALKAARRRQSGHELSTRANELSSKADERVSKANERQHGPRTLGPNDSSESVPVNMAIWEA
jgi:hypothetical protein